MAEAEAVAVAWLESDLSGVRVCTELPAALSGDTVRVTRISGSDTGQFSVYEDAVCDFDCFAADRASARTLAYRVRDSLRVRMPGQKVGTDAFVIRVRSLAGPSWTPYDNTDVRRFTYAAELRIHSI